MCSIRGVFTMYVWLKLVQYDPRSCVLKQAMYLTITLLHSIKNTQEQNWRFTVSLQLHQSINALQARSGSHDQAATIRQPRSGSHDQAATIRQTRSGSHDQADTIRQPRSGSHDQAATMPIRQPRSGRHDQAATIRQTRSGRHWEQTEEYLNFKNFTNYWN